MPELTQDEIDAQLFEDHDWIECWNCGGSGEIEGECTCWEDCCACLDPTPPRCDVCRGNGGWNGDPS